jgi:DNA-binding LacI/PurR family transcriptional regulator
MQKKIRNISIKDIAKSAGVAISTVSNVINNKDLVTDKTRDKVLRKIDKLGYKPNLLAQSLRTQKTKTIGAIVYDISNPFVARIVKGMEEVAKKRGYIMVLSCTFNDAAEEERQISVLINQFIDGLLIISGSDNAEIYKKAAMKKVPVVFVDRELENMGGGCVIIDNIQAAKSAVDYLVSLGHKEIGYISYPVGSQTIIANRFKGYCEGLESNKIPYNEDFVVIDDAYMDQELEGKDMDITFNLMQAYISKNKLPTAFITISDIIAYGLLKALRVNNIKVPQEVSVIGFDNIIFDDYVCPPLSTVKQPKKLMGITGMNLLLDIVEGKVVEKKKIILPTKIVVRESTAHASV